MNAFSQMGNFSNNIVITEDNMIKEEKSISYFCQECEQRFNANKTGLFTERHFCGKCITIHRLRKV